MPNYLVIALGTATETLITQDGKFTSPLNSPGDLVVKISSPIAAASITSSLTVQQNDDLEKYIRSDATTNGNGVVVYDEVADSLWYGIKVLNKLGEFVIPNNKRSYFRVGVKTGEFVGADQKIAVRLEISQRDPFDPYTLGEIQTLIDNSIDASGGGDLYNDKGEWDAASNITNPGGISLASGIGTKGDWYRVSFSGSTNLDGINDWQTGDYALFNGTKWEKVDNSQKSILTTPGSGLGVTETVATTTIDVVSSTLSEDSSDVVGADKIPALRNKVQGRQKKPGLAVANNLAVFNTERDTVDSGVRISTDVTLGGSSASDEVIATQRAVKVRIGMETSARQADVTSLQNALNSEISNRQSGDQTLQTNLNNEITARQNADTALANGKADKVVNAVSGNLASLDTNGNLLDSGAKAADFEPTFSKNSAFNRSYGTDSSKLQPNGTASLGSENTTPRMDHVHPSDSSKADLTYVNNQLALKLDKASVTDNLTSTSGTDALSAKQGRILDDKISLKYDASNPNGYETPTQLNNRDTNNRNRTNHTGVQAISTVSGLQTALNNKLETSLKGAAGGVAELDGTGKHPATQARPSNVTYDASNATISFTWADGSTQAIDLPLELVFQSVSYNDQTHILTFTLVGGATTNVDLSSLVDIAEIQLATQNPVAAPSTGQKMYINLTSGEVYLNSSGAWVGDKYYLTDAQKTLLGNTSGVNTGDETQLSIQTKRPLKTVAGKSLEGTGDQTLVSSDVGLGNVPNIDATNASNISTGTLADARLSSKVVLTDGVQTLTNKTLSSPAINTPSGLVKADVGLGDVDNTSDANKPISTATQTALDAKEDSIVTESTSRYISASGNDTTGKGTYPKPYATFAKAFTTAQYPLDIYARGQIITEDLAFTSAMSNTNIVGRLGIRSRNSFILSGKITTSANFTRLGVKGMQIASGVNSCVAFASGDLGRHTFENVDFSSSNTKVITFPVNFSNWCNFYNCDFSGATGYIELPNLSSGSAVIRLFNTPASISVGSGWIVYTDDVTQLNIISKSASALIIDLKTIRINSQITSQVALTALIALSSGADGAYVVNFASPTGITGIEQGDIIWKSGAVQGILCKYVDAPACVVLWVTATTQEALIKHKTLYWSVISSAGGSGASVSTVVTQNNSFTVGQWVTWVGGSYILADASDKTKLPAMGVVTAATSTQFTFQSAGIVSGLSGLTDGALHSISNTIPGALTPSPTPSVSGRLIQEVLLATSATTGLIMLSTVVTVGADYVATATNAIPYSVMSAKVDANGNPSFMTSASTQLNFDVSVPVVCCYPSGYIETNSTMASITTGISNGTNYIIKELGNNQSYFTLLKPVESKIAPSSPSTGQLWLDISVKPYIGKKWNGSAWIVTQYVKLGEVLITTLVIGTPTCYTLGDTYYGEKTQPYTSGSFASNMGTPNYSVQKFGLLCLTTVAGVGTADKFYPVVARATGGDAFSIPGYKQSDNSIDYITANVGWYINGDGGDQVAVSGTNASFKMIVVAKRDF